MTSLLPSLSFPVDIVLLFPPPRAPAPETMQAARQKLFPEEAEGERSRAGTRGKFSRGKVEKNGRLLFVFGRRGGEEGILTRRQALRSVHAVRVYVVILCARSGRCRTIASSTRTRGKSISLVDMYISSCWDLAHFGGIQNLSIRDHAPQYYGFHAPTLLSFMNTSGLSGGSGQHEDGGHPLLVPNPNCGPGGRSCLNPRMCPESSLAIALCRCNFVHFSEQSHAASVMIGRRKQLQHRAMGKINHLRSQ